MEYILPDLTSVVQSYMTVSNNDMKVAHNNMICELEDSFMCCAGATPYREDDKRPYEDFMVDLRAYMRHCRCVDKYWHRHCWYWKTYEHVDSINDGGIPTKNK